MTGVYLAVVTWDWLTVGTSGVTETAAVWPESVGASWIVGFAPGFSSWHSFVRTEEPEVVGTYFAVVAAAAVVVDVAVAAVVEEVSATVVD